MDLKNRIRVALGLDAETKLAVQEKLVDGTIIVSEADMLDRRVVPNRKYAESPRSSPRSDTDQKEQPRMTVLN